jgi:hypothetical protein
MDYIDRLTTEHGDLDDLFHEIALAKDVSTRAEILADLGRLLLTHVTLEETLIRRAAAAAPREAGLWDDWEARLRVERIVVALSAIDPAHESFAAKVASLQEMLEERIEYEENQLFPKLDRYVTPRSAPSRTMPSWHSGVAMGGAQ